MDDIRIDALGNVLAVRRGTGQVDLRVMAAAHMDEVGMMVIGFDSDGGIRFREVGGLDSRILPGARVLVGPDRIPGVIQWVPIHQNTDNKTVPIERLRIDIGAANREAAGAVEPGDLIAFDTQFAELKPTVRGKPSTTGRLRVADRAVRATHFLICVAFTAGRSQLRGRSGRQRHPAR